jgi:hypothetical protein
VAGVAGIAGVAEVAGRAAGAAAEVAWPSAAAGAAFAGTVSLLPAAVAELSVLPSAVDAVSVAAGFSLWVACGFFGAALATAVREQNAANRASFFIVVSPICEQCDAARRETLAAGALTAGPEYMRTIRPYGIDTFCSICCKLTNPGFIVKLPKKRR